MATRKTQVTITECDGCGKEFVQDESPIEPVLGFHGEVMWHHGAGGHGADWFACSPRCIKKAVINALEEAM